MGRILESLNDLLIAVDGVPQQGQSGTVSLPNGWVRSLLYGEGTGTGTIVLGTDTNKPGQIDNNSGSCFLVSRRSAGGIPVWCMVYTFHGILRQVGIVTGGRLNACELPSTISAPVEVRPEVGDMCDIEFRSELASKGLLNFLAFPLYPQNVAMLAKLNEVIVHTSAVGVTTDTGNLIDFVNLSLHT